MVRPSPPPLPTPSLALTHGPLQSATYLLASVSEPDPASTTLPGRSAALPSHAAGEPGHADAIWSSKWAAKQGGGEVVVTGSADHTLKLWSVPLPLLPGPVQHPQADLENPAHRNPEAPAAPTRTLRSPKALGVVAVDVDKHEQGAAFLVSSTLDSVITRWSIDGEHEARKTFGPGASLLPLPSSSSLPRHFGASS